MALSSPRSDPGQWFRCTYPAAEAAAMGEVEVGEAGPRKPASRRKSSERSSDGSQGDT